MQRCSRDKASGTRPTPASEVRAQCHHIDVMQILCSDAWLISLASRWQIYRTMERGPPNLVKALYSERKAIVLSPSAGDTAGVAMAQKRLPPIQFDDNDPGFLYSGTDWLLQSNVPLKGVFDETLHCADPDAIEPTLTFQYIGEDPFWIG